MLVCLVMFSFPLQRLGKMPSTLCQCPGAVGMVFSRFLLAIDKDSHDHSTDCCGKSCNDNDYCENCNSWTDEKWERVNAYYKKFAAQYERKRERKAYSKSSSSSGFFSPSILHIPVSGISANTSSFENVVPPLPQLV